MRLLQRTNMLYLLFSTALLLVAGTLLFFSLRGIVDEELNDKMYVNAHRIVAQIEAGRVPASLPPVIEVKKIVDRKEGLNIKDTIAFDPIEKDMEVFRQLRLVKVTTKGTHVITVRRVILETHDYLYSIGIVIALVFAILIIGLLVINRLVSRSVWKPFYKNMELLQTFSVQSGQSPYFAKSNIKEFSELASNLAELTKKIIADYRSLKEFTENASHEIQTPLAIVQANIEGLLEAKGLSEEDKEKLLVANASCNRLSKLTKALLLLSKIENVDTEGDSLCDASSIVKQQLEHFEDQITARQIKLKQQLEDNVKLKASKDLLTSLFSNLIFNAIRHNVDSGTLDISLNEAEFKITNTGEPFDGDTSKFFERFRKQQSSSSFGLGLAICKKICECYGYSIHYEVNNGLHTITVNF